MIPFIIWHSKDFIKGVEVQEVNKTNNLSDVAYEVKRVVVNTRGDRGAPRGDRRGGRGGRGGPRGGRRGNPRRGPGGRRDEF